MVCVVSKMADGLEDECEGVSPGRKRVRFSENLGSRPTLAKLKEFMRNEGNIIIHWYDIGVELLGNEDSIVDVIKSSAANEEDGCTNMFQTWLKRNHDASWNQLITALEKVKLTYAAFKIKRYGNSESFPVLDIHQVMNAVPVIKEKWEIIGLSLGVSKEMLNEICHKACELKIVQKSLFCCVKMLSYWFLNSNPQHVTADAIMEVISAPYVDLTEDKVSKSKDVLTSCNFSSNSIIQEYTVTPPEDHEKAYVEMKTNVCVEFKKSQSSIENILLYLQIVNVNPSIYQDVSSFPGLFASFEKHKIMNKTDISWLKTIAEHVKCTKALKIIENYESLSIADKIIWKNCILDIAGNMFFAKISNKPLESCTIKDASNAKAVMCKILEITETDGTLEFSGVGSIIFYWRVEKNTKIVIPKIIHPSILRSCRQAGITHIGTITNGNIQLRIIEFQVPKEITKRGNTAIAKYVADLRKGKAKMSHCKLILLGDAGVGKTSLLSLLTGEAFNPNHNQTEGVSTDFISTSTISSNTWKKKATETDEEYKDVASKQLAQMLSDKEEPTIYQEKRFTLNHQMVVESLVKRTKEFISKTSPKLRSKQVHMDSCHMHHSSVRYNSFLRPPTPPSFSAPFPLSLPPSLSPSPLKEVTHTTSYIVPFPRLERRRQAARQQSSYPISTDPDNVDIEIMRRSVKMKKLQSCSTVIDHELRLKFLAFDLGGQKCYKPMHHCFFTSRAVYVVVFNVRHLLNQQDQCIHELKFWINSIHIYTDDDTKIVLVGTHRGPYPGYNDNDHLDPLTPEQEKTIYSIMIKNFDKYCYNLRVSWFEGNKITAMVESSLEGDKSGVHVIRQKLLELGEQYPGNNDDLPISYLRLEAKIFKERKKNNLIFRKEVEGWAREYGIDDLTIALTFFHDTGTIIDPSKLPTIFVNEDRLSILQDTILLSPQWLADVMKELMKIERSDPKYSLKSVRKLQQDGVVNEHFLSILWEKQLKESKETFQFISIFLQAHGLIVPVELQIPQKYYIPFQLPSDSYKMKKSTSDCNQIHIIFNHDDISGFVPPFLLHHLMFKLYLDSQQSEKSCFLAAEGFIDSLHDSQWWVRQKNDDAIEVLIRTSPHVRTILPAMQYLNQSLLTILKELRAVKYILGPDAMCVHCKEENLLKYISYTDHQSDIANHLECTSCAHCEAINVSTKAVISKAYKISEISFFRQIKKFSGDVLKQLERKLKAKHKMDDEATLDDVIGELYKKNEWDPWPQVVSVLERLSYEGCNGASDLVKQIKKEQLYMCDHVE